MKRPLFAVAVYLLLARVATAQLSNPIPQPIVKGDVRIRIDDLVQMPATLSTLGGKPDNSSGARARINFLREAPDGRLFVNDLRGQLYTLDANYQPQLYLDIDAANGGSGSIFPATWFTNGLAAGFISFNFHPEFVNNGLFYTIHTERAADTTAVPDFATVDERGGNNPVRWHTVMTEWTAADPHAAAWDEATGSRREMLRVGTTADSYFHPYGDLQFNPLANPSDPDYGKMYVSGGDWGYINGAGAPQGSDTEGQPGQLQRLDTLAGTMLRIDPRSPTLTGGTAGVGDYTIPVDNPFVDGDPNTLDEIYAFGLRNAHRMVWDMDDGTLYVTNIGHAHIEEIERIIPGGNYGWPRREGTFVNGNDLANGGDGDADHVFPNNVPPELDVDFRGEPYLYPVAQYDHGEGQSIAGGFVYNGQNIPELQGKFIFGDIVRGRIFVADMDAIRDVDINNPTTNVHIEEVQLYTVNASGVETNINDLRTLVGNSRADLRFGVDADGEIYVMTKTDGFLRKLVGLDALDGLVMTVNRTTGEISFRNPGTTTIEIDGYSILSESGSLDPTDRWVRLSDQGLDGWDAATPSPNALSELNPDESLSVDHSNSWSLGNPFAPTPTEFGVSVSDIEFHYTSPSGPTREGIVEYIGQDLTNNLVLTVDPTTGEARLKNTSPFDVSIDGYSILSESGSLRPKDGSWNSLSDQAMDGWVEADPTATDLSELNPLSSLLVQAGEEFNLGMLFTPSGSQDLVFEFHIFGAMSEMPGVATYGPILDADFNRDGVVDAADYVLWRKTKGQEVAQGTLGDGNGDGLVDDYDYPLWKANFSGRLASADGAASDGQAVPEPAGLLLLGVAAALLATRRIAPTSRSGRAVRVRSRGAHRRGRLTKWASWSGKTQKGQSALENIVRRFTGGTLMQGIRGEM